MYTSAQAHLHLERQDNHQRVRGCDACASVQDIRMNVCTGVGRALALSLEDVMWWARGDTPPVYQKKKGKTFEKREKVKNKKV